MTLSAIPSLANDPNIAVALVSDTLNSTCSANFPESPSLDYTNVPTRLTGFLSTPDFLRNLLDALVVISSSTAPDGNESIACALRVDSDNATRPVVELILSSNEPIRSGTVQHFQDIWGRMLAISRIPCKRGPEREIFIQHITTFRHTMYKYTLRRLRCEFARHMAVIDVWRKQNTTPSGHLVPDLGSGDDANLRMPLVETLFHLDRCRGAFANMREEGSEPKRLVSTAQDFTVLMGSLELAKEAADKLLRQTISLRVLSMRFFKSKHVLGNAFEQITSFPRHIVDILHFAANNMESLHTHTLVLTLVSPLKPTLAASCPGTKSAWSAIRRHILREKGLFLSPCNHKPSPVSLSVHGELSLITYLHAMHFQHLETLTNPGDSLLYPAPFNYIATTLPPCTPSALWIDAYNARHSRRGDGVRFDIAQEPTMRWNNLGSGKRGWGWTPLPSLENVDETNKPNGRPRRRSVRAIPEEAAERRIVSAAWEAYARSVEARPATPVRPKEPLKKLLSTSVAGPKKAWTGPLLQTQWNDGEQVRS